MEREIDWNTEEGKQATERLKGFLRNIDKSVAKDGHVRKVISLGKGEDGQELQIITWGKS